MNRWSQFLAIAMAQLTGRSGLRDIVSNLGAQGRKFYRLGCRPVSRSSLARVNDHQPSSLYEVLLGKLLDRCQATAPHHRLRFKAKLYSLDASLMDLPLSQLPRAGY